MEHGIRSQSDIAKYWIPSYVHICVLPTATVLLDLRRNRYAAISALDSAALHGVVHDWPIAGDQREERSARTSSRIANGQKGAAALVKERFLCSGPRLSIAAASFHRSDIEVDAGIGTDIQQNVRVRMIDIVEFLSACTSAFLILHTRSLESIVRRKLGPCVSDTSAAAPLSEIENLTRLVTTFRKIRVLFFGSKGNCLLHALSLRLFLAHRGVSTTWIFGVRMNPWSAHTWLQYGRYVLDGTPGEVRYYSPILIVPAHSTGAQ